MKATDLDLGARVLKVKPKTKRKPDELVQSLFRMPWGLIVRIDALAEGLSVKRAQMVRAILEAGVKELEADRQRRQEASKPAVEKARKRKMGEGRGK